METVENTQSVFGGRTPERRYVAFVDILGFGQQVRDNFEATLEVYDAVLSSTGLLRDMRPDVTLEVYSDAFLATSEKLGSLIGVVQGLHMQTLFHDCLVRGGIGFGHHIAVSDGPNSYIVSQALVHAVEVEKRIKYPCVAIHESIAIPESWWTPDANSFHRGILYFDGIRLVNPFNIAWGQSAMTRVAQLSTQYPEHEDKYDWFLRLYEAVISGNPLVPE